MVNQPQEVSRGTTPSSDGIERRPAPTERTRNRPAATSQSAYAQQQEMTKALPVMFKRLIEQMAKSELDRVEQAEQMRLALESEQLSQKKQQQWFERIHDRLDAQARETRVSNLLLAELVAIQKLIITDNVRGIQDDVRNEAYYRVSNGE